jgi:hypothetical protein
VPSPACARRPSTPFAPELRREIKTLATLIVSLLLPGEVRHRAAVEQFDVERFVEAVARLRITRMAEAGIPAQLTSIQTMLY